MRLSLLGVVTQTPPSLTLPSSQPLHLPLPAEPRQALLAGEQFLHGALFDVAFFGDELLQGFDEGIRIAQRLGDGFLFGFGGREGNRNSRIVSSS